MPTRQKIIDDNEIVCDVDILAKALHVIEPLHRHIHKGHAFSFSHFFPAVADGTTVAVVFRGHKDSGSGVTFHIRGSISAGGDALFKFFEGSNLAGSGTTGAPINRNRDSVLESKVSGFITPTVTSYSGTTLLEEYIPGGSRAFAVGGSGGEIDEFCLPSGTTYVISIRNIAGAPKNVNLSVIWYEEGRD